MINETKLININIIKKIYYQIIFFKFLKDEIQ